MSKCLRYITLCILCIALSGCDTQERRNFIQLEYLDSILMQEPLRVKDSLKCLQPHTLKPFNRAYHALLETMALYHSNAGFTSDSLINSVVDFYSLYRRPDNNYIRALIYQSLVRYHIGSTDSAMWRPVMKAEKIYSTSHVRKYPATTGYDLFFCLGTLYQQNAISSDDANRYFIKALNLAHRLANRRLVYKCYYEIFWNSILSEKYTIAQNYLDSMRLCPQRTPDEEYLFLAAQSMYYETQNDFEKSLRCKQAQIALTPSVNRKTTPFKNYYALSESYKYLHQVDSALYFARLAIRFQPESASELNYLLYENVAELALTSHDYVTAAHYYDTTLTLLQHTIDRRVENRLIELQKKYNLHHAEQQAKVARHELYVVIILSLLLAIAVTALIFERNRRKKLDALEKLHAHTRLTQAQQKSKRYHQLITILTPYMKRQARQLHSFQLFANKLRVHNPDMADAFENILKTQHHEMKLLNEHFFTDRLMSEVLGTTAGLHLLNPSDRALLFLLAAKSSNEQIEGILNTTPQNLKSKKSYLKKKIRTHAHQFDNAETILALF